MPVNVNLDGGDIRRMMTKAEARENFQNALKMIRNRCPHDWAKVENREYSRCKHCKSILTPNNTILTDEHELLTGEEYDC